MSGVFPALLPAPMLRGALTGNGEVCLTKRLELARAKHERNQSLNESMAR